MLLAHIYQATRSIASLLSTNFFFPVPGRRQQLSSLPEITLVSLLVIVVKLYHPFDERQYSVRSLKDPAILTLSWASWLHARDEASSRRKDDRHLPHGSEINVTEHDVMKMSGEQLDSYLDWYERTWVDDERAEQKARGIPKELLEMFPTGRQDGSFPKPFEFHEEASKQQRSSDQRIHEMICKLNTRHVENDEPEGQEGAKRQGSFYKRYRSISDLPQHGRAFHEAAASAIGVKLETLLVAVLQVERKLIKWRQSQLKAKSGGRRGNESNESDSETSES